MVLPESRKIYDENDRLSPLYPNTLVDPPRLAKNNNAAEPHARPRLHEPFVSPEFAEVTQTSSPPQKNARPTILGPSIEKTTERAKFRVATYGSALSVSSSTTNNPWLVQPGNEVLQAAPLYTVRTGASDGGLLVVPPSSTNPDPFMLAKRLALSATDVSSGPSPSQDGALAKPDVQPVVCREQQQDYGFKPKAPSTTDGGLSKGSVGGEEIEQSTSQPNAAPGDLSPVVEEVVCTWGGDLRAILGQAAGSSRRRSSVVTTGMFPQSIRLR